MIEAESLGQINKDLGYNKLFLDIFGLTVQTVLDRAHTKILFWW